LLTIAGATIGKTAVVNTEILPANTNQALAIIRLKDQKHVRYVLSLLQSCLMKEYIEKSVKGSAQPNLNLQQINNFSIPFQRCDENEQRIVDILDRFDTLCNDISNGLPAEIKARQQQYEYYRDKLLTFKNIAEQEA
ncbi:MAG: restriction endonuclease subunit S, partial [Oscillospiraceae bacterium]